MSDIEFTNEEKAILVGKIQRYFQKELSEEIGQFDAEFLLDFFSKEIGAYHYNLGLHDAQKIIEEKMQQTTQTLYEMEKITEFIKT